MYSGRGLKKLQKRAGDIAGAKDARGRYVTRLHKIPLLVSRVVWELHNGEISIGVVDHEDGNVANNLITNLRLVTQPVNCRNRKIRTGNNTGVPGVYRRGHRVYAEYTVNGFRHRQSFDGSSALADAIAFRTSATPLLLADGYTERHVNGN